MWQKFPKFVSVAILNGILHGAILLFLTNIVEIWYLFSSVISTLLMVLFGFFFNNIWTWKNKKQSAKQVITIYRFLKYCIIGGCSALFGISALFLITEIFHTWFMLSYGICCVIIIFGTYIANYYWTWGNHEGAELNFIVNILGRLNLVQILKRIGIVID